MVNNSSDSNNYFSFLRKLIPLFILHFIFLYFCGYFGIGLMADDYMNLISADSSTLIQKFSSTVPYYSNFHFRPVWFLMIEMSLHLNKLINTTGINSVFFRLENLIYFYAFVIASCIFIFKVTGKTKYTLVTALLLLLYPNNLNSICWTAGKVDIICGLLIISAMIFTYNYIKEKKISDFVIVIFFFITALMTKETAVILPFITIPVFTAVLRKNVFPDLNKLFIYEILILILYFIYKIFFLNNVPSEIISAFQEPGMTNYATVFLKAFISLAVPFDFLSIQKYFHQHNLYMYLYIAVLLFLITSMVYCYIKNNSEKYLLLPAVVFTVSVLPNLAAGYFRPQLVLIPFTLFCITLISTSGKIKIYSLPLKISLTLILLMWVITGRDLVKDWNYSYGLLKSDSEIMCKTDFDFSNGKKVFLFGLPSRFRQAAIFDYVSGHYSILCMNETGKSGLISDVVNTGALDEISVNSPLILKLISGNEFEISASGETQYLIKPDFTGKEFSGKDYDIIFSDYNYFGKPVRALVKIKNPDSESYFFDNEIFLKIK